MAVVQISRIQIRRGRENSDSGIPQLASGEFGWAVDSQRLFIGNGSIAEGAPEVGNTEVLTRNSLLDFVIDYVYKKDDPRFLVGNARRTLQNKLDDHVSVADFGATGDGFTDDTAAIQQAIDQLFNNPNFIDPTSNRVVLEFASGVYLISATLKIPKWAMLKGAGKDKTIINQVDDAPIIELKSNSDGLGETIVDLVEIQDLTLTNQSMSSGISFYDVKNSIFRSVKITSNWSLGQELTENSSGLIINSSSEFSATENNYFENCEFSGFAYGILGQFNTFDNQFQSCKFSNLGKGVNFGIDVIVEANQNTGPSRNKFINCQFRDIKEHAINVLKGHGNLSKSNIFINVGNDGGDNFDAVYPIIYFDKSIGNPGNLSDGDYFDRSISLVSNTNVAYIPEISGNAFSNIKYTKTLTVPTNVGIPVVLFRLPGFNNSVYKVHYHHTSTSNNTSRSGTLHIAVNKFDDTVDLVDDYQFSGDPQLATNLNLSVQLVDLDNDGNKETVRVLYTNSTTLDTTASSFINYWYETIS